MKPKKENETQLCIFCKQEIKEYHIPDHHHPDKKNNPTYTIPVHHSCHMQHHGVYPKNYNELRQLVEARCNYQEERKRLQNQIDALKRLGLNPDDKDKKIRELMIKKENDIAKRYGKIVREMPIWKEWLVNVVGISEILAGQIIAYIGDVKRFERVSNLYSLFGYKPEKYFDFNHDLKPVMYVLVERGFIMHKKTSYYGKLYDKFKREDRKKHPEPIPNPEYEKTKKGFKNLYTDMHIHTRAMRKVSKVFLKHLWLVWRTLDKLPVTKSYEEQFLGHSPHQIPHFQFDHFVSETQIASVNQGLYETHKKIVNRHLILSKG